MLGDRAAEDRIAGVVLAVAASRLAGGVRGVAPQGGARASRMPRHRSSRGAGAGSRALASALLLRAAPRAPCLVDSTPTAAVRDVGDRLLADELVLAEPRIHPAPDARHHHHPDGQEQRLGVLAPASPCPTAKTSHRDHAASMTKNRTRRSGTERCARGQALLPNPWLGSGERARLVARHLVAGSRPAMPPPALPPGPRGGATEAVTPAGPGGVSPSGQASNGRQEPHPAPSGRRPQTVAPRRTLARAR